MAAICWGLLKFPCPKALRKFARTSVIQHWEARKRGSCKATVAAALAPLAATLNDAQTGHLAAVS
jgi:hypothetical protein